VTGNCNFEINGRQLQRYSKYIGIIDGEYVKFDCTLLRNKQFSFPKIPGFGLGQSGIRIGKTAENGSNAIPTCNTISLLTQAQDWLDGLNIQLKVNRQCKKFVGL